MQSVAENIQTNREHYDHYYRAVNVGGLVGKLRNPQQFLARAKRTGSWYGVYHDGFAERIGGKSVLELGCGDGLNALLMAALGARVVAIDISAESERIIRKASGILQLEHITPVTGDFGQIPLAPASFDFVVGKEFLHHLSPELETYYMQKVASLLTPTGEARFVEPAVNSKALDTLRWMVPVPGRPSILKRRVFAKWKAEDPHPERDNSSAHYLTQGQRYFGDVRIVPYGSIDRFHRFLRKGEACDRFRVWAHGIEPKLPYWFRRRAARGQLIVYRHPRR
jgi:SAM-dependent methyltransferase